MPASPDRAFDGRCIDDKMAALFRRVDSVWLSVLNFLEEPLIRAHLTAGAEVRLSLPDVFVAMGRDEVATFPALRAHQRHAWHAFLCQLAVLALSQAGRCELWTDAAGWREGLRGLTPDHKDDSPWCLVAPADRPALLQPPIPGGMSTLPKTVATPDALDMLVTARNHDLKAAVMARAMPEHWIFSLVTLQTMQGYSGATNYGVCRMNGGFASRPAVSVEPAGGIGRHFVRDVLRLLALRSDSKRTDHFLQSGRLGLVWLLPWDGTQSLRWDQIDELFIEICRLVRLVPTGDGELYARARGSKVARIVPTGGGLTGDPWAPLVTKGDTRKVLNVQNTGFHYPRMVKLMFPQVNDAAPLQILASSDDSEGLVLLARALARSDGSTEGYHERRVPLSRHLVRMARTRATDPAAELANKRVKLAGEVSRILRVALLALFQGGPDRIDERDRDGGRKAQPFLDRYDTQVDRDFFDDLALEIEAEDKNAERARWVGKLLAVAQEIVRQADHAAPKSSNRRLRARVASQGVLAGYPFRNEELRPYLPERSLDAV